jgi:thymidylate kinase
VSFYILEGPNGCGKSTVLKNLKAQGVDTFESPGDGTELSKVLRPWCRGTAASDIAPEVQFYLFTAARLDEYNRRVRDVAHPVVTGRWWTSTFVYQCLYQGLSLSKLESTLDPSEHIDKMFLLTADPQVLVDRVRKEREANPDHGKCSWTKDYEKTLSRLYSIYMTALPVYMVARGVPVVTVDTTFMDAEKVTQYVMQEIK